MAASDDLDTVVERYHLALDAIVKGDAEPLKALYSHRDDVSLANPHGPAASGWEDVAARMEHAATLYKDGEAMGFDHVARFEAPELACTVEVERFRAKVGGSDDISPIALRVTSIYRSEDGVWKIVHRHADPITTARPPEAVIQK